MYLLSRYLENKSKQESYLVCTNDAGTFTEPVRDILKMIIQSNITYYNLTYKNFVEILWNLNIQDFYKFISFKYYELCDLLKCDDIVPFINIYWNPNHMTIGHTKNFSVQLKYSNVLEIRYMDYAKYNGDGIGILLDKPFSPFAFCYIDHVNWWNLKIDINQYKLNRQTVLLIFTLMKNKKLAKKVISYLEYIPPDQILYDMMQVS
jgi:hypothetical protein